MVQGTGGKSKMLPVGLSLLVGGLVLSPLVYRYAWAGEFDGESTVAVLLLLAALLALLVPVGIVLAVIGLVRNRKAKT